MRLINTETLELHEFFESQAPPYAILSHTWDKDEITFQEMSSKAPSSMLRAGYKKIQDTCKIAQTRGWKWAWIDTCCIDKSSSAELTESINSMFRWYQKAEECYAYLADFAPGSSLRDKLGKCRWFTRGFTLQELIAPKFVILFDQDWNAMGEKRDQDMLEIIGRITRISKDVLLHLRPLTDFSIAERMLWASTRETTRPEDRAYCLLGIFEVNMPLIYGEGDNAFRRLQEEIIKRSNDLSIFVWGTPLNSRPAKHGKDTAENASLDPFASSPADFWATWEHREKGNSHIMFLDKRSIHALPEFTLTNKGLNMSTTMGLVEINDTRSGERLAIYYTIYVGIYVGRYGITPFAVLLDKVGPGLYVRLGVRFQNEFEYFLSSRDGSPFKASSIANTIFMDHRTLLKVKEEIFDHTVSLRWSSNMRVERIDYMLPRTHWDASRYLFFPPLSGIYGQLYDIACARLHLEFTQKNLGLSKCSCDLYLIINFRNWTWSGGEIPRAFLLGEDDLPEITSLIHQSYIHHRVFFPNDGDQSYHLLNKGPEYGRKKVVTFTNSGRGISRRVVISVKSAITQPPVEFRYVFGKVRTENQFTVILHATVEENVVG